jgi:cellulose synthase operon protein C
MTKIRDKSYLRLFFISGWGLFFFLFLTAHGAGQAGADTTQGGATSQPIATAPASNAPSNASGIASVASAPVAAATSSQVEQPPWANIDDVTGLGTQAAALSAGKTTVVDRKPPSGQQQSALGEMETEVNRYEKIGGSYKQSVVSLVRRAYQSQRREMDRGFSTKIREEETIEDKARLKSIELFERFVQKYPDDPAYTPDAIFRLGELYYERTSIDFQNNMEKYYQERDRRLEKGEPLDDLVEPKKDFSNTIKLYARLVKNFPNYSRLDGVYYLIGYCLNDMGEPPKARLAWLNLVCGNKFQFKEEDAVPEPEPSSEAAKEEKLKEAHPALTMDKKTEETAVTPFDDPFAGCEPAVKDSKFYAETWLRIGEYHFDFDFSPHGLDTSISAYKKVLERPQDRNYNLALYKVAWAYYRASRYPEAIKNFWELVEWSDKERVRTGKGSELRTEAIQYLGIAFAYDDWNENQIPDVKEGMPSGIERVQDSKLIPQDRAWTSEVYYQVGYIFFDEAKYPEAVQIWQIALRRWPLNPRAPEIQNMIAQAHTRHNEPELAIEARAKLSNYGQGTDWWEANKDHPLEQRNAEKLAEEVLIATAIVYHQRAQNLRRQCVENKDVNLCTLAQESYGLAAKTYREYIRRYPNNPQAYELQYNLADALYWSQNYEEAAREYAAVRDSNLDDKYLAISARLVVESIKRLNDQAVESGQLKLREEPPEAQGVPPRVSTVSMPRLLMRLAKARDNYMTRVDDAHDSENLRPSYYFNNTLLLYQYGYWSLARKRFETLLEERCRGPKADETGRVAWLNLRNIAVTSDEVEEVRRLGTVIQEKQCTFSSTGTGLASVDCTKEENKENPRCIAGSDLTNLRYRDAVAIFEQAEKATGDEQRKLYERAATELVKAVNDEPKHAQAPLALEKAGIALERTSRFESAGRLYQRIIDEVGPRQGKDPEEQKSLDAILSNAYFRLAYNANRFFDFDRAVDNYRILADSERFAKSKDPTMTERREGALINAAKILEYQQQYKRAADYYARAADILRDGNEVRAARYRVAEMAYKQKNWQQTIKEMKAFIDKYQKDSAAGELIVQAYWRIAEAKLALGQKKEYRTALQDVVNAFSRTKQAAGSYAAEYAANAQFVLVDEGASSFEKFQIKSGSPGTLDGYVKSVTQQIASGSNEAKSRAEGYSLIPTYRRPNWTIAAFVQQGRIYEVLAKAVLNTPFVVPADLKKKMRGLPEDSKVEIKTQVEDAIRQLLDKEVRPIECLAVARYALAARAGSAGNVDNEYTRRSTDRINAYGDERIAECVSQAAAKDPSFAAYKTGEFARAPRGLDLDIPASVSPPPLSAGE